MRGKIEVEVDFLPGGMYCTEKLRLGLSGLAGFCGVMSSGNYGIRCLNLI